VKQVDYAIVGTLAMVLIGTIGCGEMPSNRPAQTVTGNSQLALTAHNQTGGRQTLTSSNRTKSLTADQTPTTVIERIQPQPSGLLIKLKNVATSATRRIIYAPRFRDSNLSLSFILQNVQVANPSIAHLNEMVGNQLIQNLKVQKYGTDLLVRLTLMQPMNKINIGTSGPYLGIALQYKPNKPMPAPHAVGNIPAWFFKDILTAASTEGTPERAYGYGGMLPFQFSDKTYMLKAPHPRSLEVMGFSAYFGSLPLYGNYLGMLNPANDAAVFEQAKYGLIREEKNGKSYGVRAIMVNMQNGWALGFAENQLIVEESKAGFLGYTVYPVQGIKLGAPLP
jgi:hypothetical protein